MKKNELITQLELTVSCLERKIAESPEPIVIEYLKKYRAAIASLKRLGSNSSSKTHLNALLNSARGYMETSSNYRQEFLNEMGKSEKLIMQLQSKI
ncbi:hypothetical protein [Shewanella sp. UCD-KL12]|uniref:hypothetical protein n=1 Tax=Shewanella sp. UCD-KL12 TaxID=1917163 RepID=UPI00097083D4|nr:hypothetical protein [Shewanella sp. UCD-KL12]